MTVSDRIRVKNVRLLSDNYRYAEGHHLRMAARQRRMADASTARPSTAAMPPRCCPTIWRSAPWCWCGSSAIPAYVNGYDDLLIEAAAGLLDDESPEVRIRAEAEEETGYRLGEIRKMFEAFMSPGSVTEKLHFFVAEYEPEMQIGSGGGIADEGEDIEVLELSIDEALAMIGDGRIVDAKTIMLLQYAALNIFRQH